MKLKMKWTLPFISLIVLSYPLQSQSIKLTLKDFQNNKGSWQEVGQVQTNPLKDRSIKGSGNGDIMVNLPGNKKPGNDLVSSKKFGDADIRLDYMMAPGSNSGIYIQGQYEIQLLDSWTKTNPQAGDNGGIYERWDETKPEGQKGYQGYAPRQNASRAPGTWQNLRILFKAPRFDSQGKKISNANIVSIHLNGVKIHENVELFGPTRGSLSGGEVALGPIRIQGDHGPIAIKNLEITEYKRKAPQFKDLSFRVYEGSIQEISEIQGIQPALVGEIDNFFEYTTGLTASSLTKFEGNLQVNESGKYSFGLTVPNGLGAIQTGGAGGNVLKRGTTNLQLTLDAGNHPVEIWVSKPDDWTTEGFYLRAASEGMWTEEYSKPAGLEFWTSDPIHVDPKDVPIVRSFLEVPNAPKISHGISVSSNQGTHYSYDLNSNQLIRVWRGKFLDATPMWYNRGNGVSLPLGTVQELNQGDHLFYDENITPISMKWKPKGYQVVNHGNVIFKSINEHGSDLHDQIQILEGGKGIERTLKVSTNPEIYYIKIAQGSKLLSLGDGMFWIEDQGIFLSSTENLNPRVIEGFIYLPFKDSLTYRILF
ncbi:3-keto-disaccharide hydrolase [Algoriphagus algorifonticola]|uniref:3-keto-disaccharide hydrolase n=1 Tax=Algoriphagus algorifonticola TaxID=2593007 RepID=UPI0011A5F244|nr:DUF1080 domain-containing protein [Algoriphagus algorifonticola]